VDLDDSQMVSDKEIDRKLEEQKKVMANEIRLLLLGAGESGKSTMAKQLRILHGGGFTDEEKHSYKQAILQNIWESIGVIYQASEALEVNIKKKNNRMFAIQFLQPFPGTIKPELAEGIEQFWGDSGTQKLYKRRKEYQLIDSFEYYMHHIRRILEPNFQPNEQDVLRVRIQTTGIIKTNFQANGKNFVLLDVGGQRSERKKWVHCFEDVLGVLFCIGISEFDQTLYEDNATNRMLEAKKLFHEVCQSKWFSQTAMILFMNKEDLFREKLLLGGTIRSAFPEYEGNDTYEESIKFLESKFRDVINPTTGKAREVYVHVTCATDTSCVSVVFKAVTNFIAQLAFQQMGMM